MNIQRGRGPPRRDRLRAVYIRVLGNAEQYFSNPDKENNNSYVQLF
jgi:hypothetical protein